MRKHARMRRANGAAMRRCSGVWMRPQTHTTQLWAAPVCSSAACKHRGGKGCAPWPRAQELEKACPLHGAMCLLHKVGHTARCPGSYAHPDGMPPWRVLAWHAAHLSPLHGAAHHSPLHQAPIPALPRVHPGVLQPGAQAHPPWAGEHPSRPPSTHSRASMNFTASSAGLPFARGALPSTSRCTSSSSGT